MSALTVVAGSFFISLPLSAQPTGAILGSVADSTGAPIFGAEVTLASTSESVYTDDRGNFQFHLVPEGSAVLRARRLGFVPGSVEISVVSGTSTRTLIKLARTPTMLPPLAIRTKRVDFTGRLAGYYQRLESQSGAYFITRDQIDHENPTRLSQLLVHVPAVTANRIRGGGGGVRMRGRNCWPLVWLDGNMMGAGEVDLDSFSPQTIQGIELYLGSTSAPLRYQADRGQSSCGTILLWSRGPDTDPVFKPATQNWDFQRMVESLTIFTADQVDQPAAPDAGKPIEVKYPPALFASGVRGSVLAEFVVDSAGKIEYESLGIVSSTHPLFSDAVRQALEGARYKPAMRKGVAVRQLVQQPFDFLLNSAKRPGG